MGSERVRFGDVSGAWHHPQGEIAAALILGHGAGGDMDGPLLVAVCEGLAARGVACVRFNFPYREAGRRAPGPQRHDEACYRSVIESVAREFPHPFCGGRSYGGRIASHLAAEGVEMSGLVFLGYPLHPPGKPERIRDAHLGAIRCPMLFCQGTRDPFARPDLLHRTVDALPGAVLHEVEGGDHSFRVRGRSEDEVGAELTDVIASFVGERAG